MLWQNMLQQQQAESTNETTDNQTGNHHTTTTDMAPKKSFACGLLSGFWPTWVATCHSPITRTQEHEKKLIIFLIKKNL